MKSSCSSVRVVFAILSSILLLAQTALAKSPAEITLAGLSHAYDGAAKPASATTDPPGLLVSFTYGGSPTAPITAGSYEVVATIDDDNYDGTASGILVISKAVATLTLGDLAATFDGSAKEASAATDPEGLAVNLTYNDFPGAPTSAGSYEVVATIDDPNFEGSASGTLVISKAVATVTLGDLAATFDGSAKSPSATTNPEGLTVSLTYDGGTEAPTGAGAYEVVVTVQESNYQGSATGTLVISKALATVTLEDLTPTYDGSPKSASATTDPEALMIVLAYDGESEAPAGASHYEVVATVEDANYEGSATGTLTILKAPVSVTIADLAAIYDGAPKPASAATDPEGLAVGITYNGESDIPTAAGSYEVVATVDDTNYQGSATGTLIISKALANVTLSGLAATYDGSPKGASVATDPEGLTVVLTYNADPASPADAGNYAVVATIDDANYEGNATGTLVISKAVATVTLGNLAATFDGTAKAVSATTSPEGLTVSLTYDGSAAAPTAAGSYPVVAITEDANYEGSASGTLVIGKAVATVTLGDLAATYDGSPHAASATTSPEGFTVSLTYDGSTTAPTAAGSYAVVGTIDDVNYAGTASGTLVIGIAVATVTLGDLAATYDGTAKEASAATDPEGITVSLTYDGSPTAPIAAGSYEVVATIDDANYVGTATGTLVISKAAATVTLGDLAATYDGSAKAASAATDPEGLTVSLTYDGSATAPITAGNYAVVATIDDANYEGIAFGTLVISKAVATVSLDDLAATYDGSPHAASATTSPEGLTVDLTYDDSTTPPIAAGSYAVVATIDDDNYEGSVSGILVIGKAVATVTLGDLAATYDGLAKEASAATDPEGLTVSLTYDGSATAPSTAGNYAVVATIDDANYEGIASGTLVISKAVATVTLGDLAAIYDGSAKEASAMTDPQELTVNLTYNGSSTAPTSAGSYEVVATIDDANFEGTASETLVISKSLATITLDDLAATYDGSGKAATATTDPAGLTVNLTYDGTDTLPISAASYAVEATVVDSNYTGAATGILVIDRASQVISFPGILDQTLGSAPFELSASAASGLTVAYSLVSGPASVSGSTLTLNGLGVVTVQAEQAGNGDWLPASPVQQTFSVVAGEFSQGYIWANGYGGTGFDTAHAVAADASGQAYVLGDFENTVTFGTSTFSAAGGSLSDLVLLKVNNDGSIAWARQFGGVNSDLAKAVVALPSGGVVAGGEFFTSTVISGTTLTSAGSKDIVLVEVDADGNTVWSKRFGGTSSDSLHSMAVDADGNLYMAGQFSGSITFGTNSTLTSSGSSDGFIVKLDSTGTPLWSRKMGGSGADIAYSVAVKSTGEIAVAGSFNGGATFGSVTLSSAGSTDGFATVLDSSGTFLWARRFGGTTADNARAAAFDAAGNLWVAGSFTGSSATGFGSTNLASAGAEDAYVVRLATADGAVLEASRYGGTGSDTAISLAADPFGTMMLAGSFQNSVAFGSTTLVSAGLTDTYVAKIRAGSGVVWALRGGGGNDDRSQALSVNDSGEIFHAGVFDTGASFGTHAVTGGGWWDLFIAKINGPVPAFTAAFADFSVDEGDPWSLATGTLGAEPVAFQWFKNGEAISGATSSVLEASAALPTDAGVYVLQATNAYGSSSTPPITVTVRVPDQVLSVEPPLVSSENRTIEAPVYLDSLGDVTGLSFIIAYDKAHLTNPIFALGPHLVAGNSSVVIDKDAGTVRVIGSAFPSSFPEGRRLVGTLTATTRSVPAGASITLTPNLLSISDIFGGPIGGYTKLKAGTMAIAQREIPGDANNNGRLDVSDAAELIRLYANPAQIRPWDHYLNDLNLDGILTEGDATRVLRVVADLDQAPSFPQSAPTMNQTVPVQSAAMEPTADSTDTEVRNARMPKNYDPSAGGPVAHTSPPLPAARLVLTRLTGANANKVLARVYLDDVPAGQAGVSFQVDYPAAVLRIAGASSLIAPSGGLPSGVAPTWNVAPGNHYAAQTGRVSLAAAWGSEWTFSNGQAVANIVFEIHPAATGQVHFPLTLAEVETGPYNAEGPSTPLAATGGVVTFTRTYADWALATLGNATADPDADSDGDGFTNQQEFAASTNPNDANSRLQTTSAAMTAEGFKLRWFAAYGVSYKVRWSGDLKNWNDLATPHTGTGAETEVTDPAPPAGGRFYRVEVVQP